MSNFYYSVISVPYHFLLGLYRRATDSESIKVLMARDFQLGALELTIEGVSPLVISNGVDGYHAAIPRTEQPHRYYSRDGVKPSSHSKKYRSQPDTTNVLNKTKRHDSKTPVNIPTSPRRLTKRSVPFRKHVTLFR